jgi:electron transfer flavoprotein alpha subunit
MAAILAYSEDAALRGELCAHGATLGEVHEADPQSLGLPDSDTMTAALALQAAAQKIGAALVLVGATKRGKDVAARLAGLLDWPYASECQSIQGGDTWTVERMVLSGNSKASYRLGARAVVSAVPRTFEGAGKGTPVAAQTVAASRLKSTPRGAAGHSDFDLGSASVVIGVGRGFKKKEDIELAERLAKCFPGGAVGCSRPIAADLKWLGEEHWIGLSGHAIKPKAYIACGVSGQIQHVAGIRGAKLIIAINTNKDAPIFQVSDYGVVGDLYQVIPKLVQSLGS